MSENPYTLGTPPAEEQAPPDLAPARALMRHRLFALMHAAVMVMLLGILGTVLRSGGMTDTTALPVIFLSILSLFLAANAVLSLRAHPLSLPMGVLADLVCLCSCFFTLPAIWSLALRFGSQPIHQALVSPPPLRAWSPHWPTVILLPLLTGVNLLVPIFLTVWSAM